MRGVHLVANSSPFVRPLGWGCVSSTEGDQVRIAGCMNDPEEQSRFETIVASSEAELNLAGAALALARDEYPTLGVQTYLARLDELADTVRARVPDSDQLPDLARALSEHLFENEGFAGNTEHYADPRNSYLNDVIDRRLGIPITLCVVYLEVGWRLGIPMQGVSFPGHFLVKFAYRGGEVVLDPFFKGVSLSETQLVERIERIAGDAVSARSMLPRFLAAVDKRTILARILRNLKAIFIDMGRLDRALLACEKICLLTPDDPDEIRDRGMLYERLQSFRAAFVDYQRYLKLAPQAPDADKIRARLRDLEPRAATLNS